MYVDATWAGLPNGTGVYFPGDAVDELFIGTDAFATVQGSVNALTSPGQKVYLAAGTYTEQVTISQSLSLIGAGSSTTFLQPPSGVNSGAELSIASGLTVSIAGVSVEGGSGMTGMLVQGGASATITASSVTGAAAGILVSGASSLMVTDSTITGDTIGVMVGSGAGDTCTATVTNDNLSGDTTGVQNLQTTGSVNATFDWWGGGFGPITPPNPGGNGSGLIGKASFSPWLGDANLSSADILVFLATKGNQYVVTPNSADTILNVTLGGSPVASIAGGGQLVFTGNGGSVAINGETGPGSTDAFNINDTSVEYNVADGLKGDMINFFGTGLTRNVDARGTTNTFNIQGAGASGPSGSLVGDSGNNVFVFSGTGMVLGNIQGAGASTLNYSAYFSAVTVNLGNGTNGTATGVVVPGTVTGIKAVIGSQFNDTLSAGSVAGVALTGGSGTNSLSGTGAGDSVVESIASSYTLTNSQLTGNGAFTDNLSAITVATLSGNSLTSNAFTVSGWTGTGSLAVPSGTATVTASEAANYTLTNRSLSSTNGMSLTLSGITTANLIATGAGQSFTVSGWTGSGSLTGTTAAVTDSASGSFTLTSALLTAPNTALILSGITTANLTDTGSGNTFTISGLTGGGSLTGHADTLVDSVSANVTLSDGSLLVTGLPALTMSGIKTANLTDAGGGHTFTVSGWTGTGSLTAPMAIPDTVAATESANITLTNAMLTSGTMSFSLSYITAASLTVTASSGHPSDIIDASAFSAGPTNLTAAGTVDAILYGGTGGHDLLTVAEVESGNNILIGNGEYDRLIDIGTGRNILIGGGAGHDVIYGHGNDILLSGTTTYDSDTTGNIAALDAILAEWTSADSYAVRISNIIRGVGPGNADKFNFDTVKRDKYSNTLSDGNTTNQQNWFLSWSGDYVNKEPNETDTFL